MQTDRPTRRRLRVLTLIDRPITTGGGERMAAVIAAGLDPARFDSTLCSSRSSEAETFEAELRDRGVRVLVLQRRSKAAVWAWAPLLSFLRRERIDILHTHKFGSNVWGTVIGRIVRVPVIVAHEHSWSYTGQPLRRFLDRELVGRVADVFLAVSDEDRRRMIEIERVESAKVRVIPNGISSPVPTERSVRAELGIGPAAPVVGTVAQLRAEKALDVLIDAALELRATFPEARVLIAGHGPEEESLRSRIAAADLDGTVILLGRRNDVPDVLAAIDVAVCCSDMEGSPLSVMEYMAAGKPVVATRVGGLPGLVEDGVSGRLVEPRDPAGLAAALVDLLSNEVQREAMGRAGHRRQERDFSLAATIGRIEDLYEALFRSTERAGRENWARVL